jgi:hypothetical protein
MPWAGVKIKNSARRVHHMIMNPGPEIGTRLLSTIKNKSLRRVVV